MTEKRIIRCPKCNSTSVLASEYNEFQVCYRQYSDGQPFLEEPYEKYKLECTGKPVSFFCDERDCDHEWVDPEGRTRLEDVLVIEDLPEGVCTA